MAEDVPAVIRLYLDRWFTKDIDAMAPLLADDLILWHNHIGKEFGKADMLGFVRGSLDVLAKVEFRNPRWTVVNADTVLLQHDMHVETTDGRILSGIPNAILYRLKNGQIVRIDEYVDGPAFAPLGLA